MRFLAKKSPGRAVSDRSQRRPPPAEQADRGCTRATVRTGWRVGGSRSPQPAGAAEAGRCCSAREQRDAELSSVWLPWLAAPLFALLPLGGCGIAGYLQRPRGQVAAPHRGSAEHHLPAAASFATLAPQR